MRISVTKIEDLVSSDLAARLAKVENRVEIHRGIGTLVVSLTKRAFNDATLRPAPWPALASGGPATLRKSGTLAKSIRLVAATNTEALVASDREYAAIHQLGGVTPPRTIKARKGKALKIPGIGFRKSVKHPGSRVPARPYFPFDRQGNPSSTAHRHIVDLVEKMLKP